MAQDLGRSLSALQRGERRRPSNIPVLGITATFVVSIHKLTIITKASFNQLSLVPQARLNVRQAPRFPCDLSKHMAPGPKQSFTGHFVVVTRCDICGCAVAVRANCVAACAFIVLRFELSTPFVALSVNRLGGCVFAFAPTDCAAGRAPLRGPAGIPWFLAGRAAPSRGRGVHNAGHTFLEDPLKAAGRRVLRLDGPGVRRPRRRTSPNLRKGGTKLGLNPLRVWGAEFLTPMLWMNVSGRKQRCWRQSLIARTAPS